MDARSRDPGPEVFFAAPIPGNCRSAASPGFTLVEIMIATAILTLGLVGILALFPVAIRAGRQVVEDTNAVVIAQSVSEAIRSSIRNRKRYVDRGSVTHTYFVFEHDGVRDPVPADRRLERPAHDYYILLPRFRPRQVFGGETEFEARSSAMREARTFVYPETDSPPNGDGDAFRAQDDSKDQTVLLGGARSQTIRVSKTYPLGSSLVPGQNDPNAPLGPDVLRDIKIDTLRQYSFAFSIQPSFFDADEREGKEFQPMNRLFFVTVMVFRSFPKEVREGQELPQPVYQIEFEVSL
jgi:prepilin-type N-terminal cleavage/methylation domain-containing protein